MQPPAPNPPSPPQPTTTTANPQSPSHPPSPASLAAFRREGLALLDAFTTHQATAAAGLPWADPAPEAARKVLRRALWDAAGQWGVVRGKWMLYTPPASLPTIWRIIHTATEAGRLGPSASVSTSPSPSSGDDDSDLVCVHTRDFRDVADVRRVLEALVEMGAVQRTGTVGIPYKCDAYEQLGIFWDNEWGLRESVYGSREVLEGTVVEGGGWDPEDGVSY